jgi:hypothetical protein
MGGVSLPIGRPLLLQGILSRSGISPPPLFMNENILGYPLKKKGVRTLQQPPGSFAGLVPVEALR